MYITIIIVYTLALTIVFLYSLSQLNLLFGYLKSKKTTTNEGPQFDLSKPDETPCVTIQLPVFNELYVMERLLDNIALLDYPSEKLEVQVLDDSTDESIVTTANKVKQLQEKGLDIKHIHRTNRQGFKAGALKEGLKEASGEFVAIFDADFLPEPDWLKKTIPHFKNPKIGVVQTRWGHINRDYSLLTKIQALSLDYHFTMEQSGRNFKKHFINFNGTAGIWRKTCIVDAGNWQGDTLTEDLDLSYRAQLNQWEFKYLEDVVTPAELPMIVSASRSQQFRWNKGAAENFKKTYKRVLKCDKTPWKTKMHSFFHLLNSSMFILILTMAILSVPVLYIKNEHPVLNLYFNISSVFALSSVIFFVNYWVSYKNIHGGGFKNFSQYVGLFLTYFSVAMGFSLHNSIAVLEGHFGKKSEFIRTPKFNMNKISDKWRGNKYINKNISKHTILEALLMCYFAFALYSGVQIGDYGLFGFHLMLFSGFGFVFFKSVTDKL